MGTPKTLSLAAVTAVLIGGATAFAVDPVPPLTIQVDRDGVNAYDNVIFGAEASPYFYEYFVEYDDPFGMWSMDYTWEYDANTTSIPGTGGANAFASFGLTNNTGEAEVFTVTAFVPLLQALEMTTTAGDVEGSLADSNFDGLSLLQDAGQPIYSGLVDGNVDLTLMNDPFVFSAPEFGQADFGPFADSGAGPALAEMTIGIEITFELSDGDTASFTANYLIEGNLAPAPGALALLGLAGLAGTRRRRH